MLKGWKDVLSGLEQHELGGEWERRWRLTEERYGPLSFLRSPLNHVSINCTEDIYPL